MEALKTLRKESGMTQEKMASKLGVTLSYYQKVEQGSVPAAAGFIRKLKKAFPFISTDIFFSEGR